MVYSHKDGIVVIVKAKEVGFVMDWEDVEESQNKIEGEVLHRGHY